MQNNDVNESIESIWCPQPGPQVLAVTCPVDLTFFGGSRGGGKSSANSARLLTSKGWKLFSEVQVGDSITDPENGGSQLVLDVFPQGEMDIYRVSFDDGATTYVTLDHYWTYKCANRPRPRSKKSKQRDFLKEKYGVDTYSKGRYVHFKLGKTEALIKELKSGKHNPRIPLTAPVMFDVNGRTGKSELDPYLIGLMLGDGTFSSGKSGNSIACADKENIEYLKSLGFVASGSKVSEENCIVWYLPVSAEMNNVLNSWANNHGLLGKTGKSKFIPDYVFTAGLEYRLSVLQGLLDSDGYVDDRGHIEFTNVSESLVYGVQDLVRSFGGKATVGEPLVGSYRNELGEKVECQEYRRVYIQSDLASLFFRLTRKKSRCVGHWNGGHENMRKVVSIEYSHREEATCIKVSAYHGLYVTDDYVVTHNTDCAIGRQIIGAMKHGFKWNGLFLRKNFKHFSELRRRIDELIRAGLPAHRVGGDNQTNVLKFENGARVMLTAIERPEQLDFFQGQAYTLVCIEEACQFGFVDEMIDKLKACMRSAHGVKCSMFLTGNPGGQGHSAIKRRFITPDKRGGVPIADGEDTAIFIPSNVAENRVLCDNDPKYVQRLKSIRDPKLRRAWLLGDWDVVLGGFFDDVWDPFRHVVPRFRPPSHWPRLVGLDWGTARPFSIGWYAVASGERVEGYEYWFPAGALVRYAEWYGCKKDETNVGLRLNSTQVAQEMLRLEKERGEDRLIFDRIADPSIFKEDDGPSIAEKFATNDVVFRKADNRRVAGWDEVRTLLQGKEQDDGKCPPLLYITENCTELVRTLPLQQRDEKDWESIDTDGEDHAVDELRYVCMSRPSKGRTAEDLSRTKGDLAEQMNAQADWAEITDPDASLGRPEDLPLNVDAWDFDEYGAPLQ